MPFDNPNRTPETQINAELAAASDQFRIAADQIRTSFDELRSLEQQMRSDHSDDALLKDAQAMSVIGQRFASDMDAAKVTKIQNEQHLRKFQNQRGLQRPVDHIELFNSLALLMAFWLFGGGIAAFLMLGSGEFDAVMSVVYGMAFETIVMVVSVVNGHFCLRYINFNCTTKSAQHNRNIRILSRIGFGFFISLALVLIFSAARVRAIGGHEDIFDFSEVGFFATFNDYFAIGILVVGLIGLLVSVREGYQGFSDREPDYSKNAIGAPRILNDAVARNKQNALNHIDDLFDVALDNADAEADLQRDAIKLYNKQRSIVAEKVCRLRGDISAAKTSLQIRYTDLITDHEYAYNTAFDGPDISFDSLDLFIPDSLDDTTGTNFFPQLNGSNSNSGAKDQLRTRFREAEALIDTAHAKYISAKPDFPLHNTTGDNHETV